MSDMVGQILGAIEKVVDERFNSFETAVPGVVTAVRNDGRVDVMPSVRKMVTSGVIDRFDAPVRGVPLMQIGFSGMAFDLEVSNGDTVILLFMSRDASQWKKRKWEKQCDPKSPFANDANSCVAIPFVRPDSGAKAVVKIDKDGKIVFDSSMVKFTGDVEVEGDVKGKGKIDADGDIESGGNMKGQDFKTATVSFLQHTHVAAAAVDTPTAPVPFPYTPPA